MQSTASMKKARPRRTIWIFLAVIAVIVLLGVLVGPRIAERMSERTAGLNAQSGDVVAAFVGDLSSSATASGQVEAIQKAHLAANTPGLVEAVYVQVGDQVQAGKVSD